MLSVGEWRVEALEKGTAATIDDGNVKPSHSVDLPSITLHVSCVSCLVGRYCEGESR